MNVTKDKNGVNVTGLTDNEALALMTLVGNVTWSRTPRIYNSLSTLFPEYQTIWTKHYNGNNTTIILSNEQQKIHNTIIDEVLNHRVHRPSAAQRRDASGRFLKKVWVARFSYPDSKYRWQNVSRTVITNDDGRSRPNLSFGDSIEGVDLARGAFRKFSFYKVVGNVKWTREYADQVK